MSLHVLMVPAWFSSRQRPALGSFFRCQAEAVSKAGLETGIAYSEMYPPSFILSKKKMEFGVKNYVENGVNYCKSFFPRFPQVSNCGKSINEPLLSYLKKYTFECYLERFGCPDVVHIQSMLRNENFVFWLKKTYDIPIVLTEHFSGFIRNGFSEKEVAKYTEAFSCCDIKLAVSSFFSGLLVEIYGVKFDIMPNPVDCDFFQIAPKLSTFDGFHFSHIAFLNEVKNQMMLVRSFFDAFGGDESVTLTIGGDGPEREKLESEIEKLGMAQRVILTGTLDRYQVRTLLHDSHAFVLSSKFETFGVAVVEAMSSGLPVVVTQCGGPETFVSPMQGVLCEVSRVGLKSALLEMRNSWGGFNSTEIRNEVMSQFSQEIVGEKLVSIYSKALGNV